MIPKWLPFGILENKQMILFYSKSTVWNPKVLLVGYTERDANLQTNNQENCGSWEVKMNDPRKLFLTDPINFLCLRVIQGKHAPSRN